ncbi:hypothetical protein Adt_23397 [Abeliophyllum distichum]|uniref:Uncharacterized protein n=1 Tax=Abeliophyllum distichum TaxID=126358 RepID=A0ABD1SAS5_9LAMI
MALPQETLGSVRTSPIAAQGPITDSFSWVERVNNWSLQYALDLVFLEKLPPPSARVAASVHRYWTSIWAGTVEGTDLPELIKMVEMNIVHSHVLNYKLYEMFVMKVDELCSKVVGTEDMDVLHSENKALHASLAISKEERA